MSKPRVEELPENGAKFTVVPLLAECNLAAREQRLVQVVVERAIRAANNTPFRSHAADDIDFHSGCEQTRDRIVAHIRQLATPENVAALIAEAKGEK